MLKNRFFDKLQLNLEFRGVKIFLGLFGDRGGDILFRYWIREKMVGGNSRREESLVINSTNVFAALWEFEEEEEEEEK